MNILIVKGSPKSRESNTDRMANALAVTLDGIGDTYTVIDLNNVSNSVYNSIGIHPKIIRFPGGSSNTISKNYSNGIMSRLTNEVINRGYTYFDWNVDSNDAGGDGYNSNKIYNNVINGLSHSKTNIVLMHDSESHSASVDALRNIIKYGKNNGYTFKAITSDTPIVRHGVNN